jgi:hypothetical protein
MPPFTSTTTIAAVPNCGFKSSSDQSEDSAELERQKKTSPSTCLKWRKARMAKTSRLAALVFGTDKAQLKSTCFLKKIPEKKSCTG